MSSARQLVTFRPRDTLDRVFAFSVVVKGLDGLLEVIGGVLLLLITPTQIVELADVVGMVLGWFGAPATVGTWAIDAAEQTTTAGLGFGAVYLLAHGLVKVVLVAALLRNKIWAYPWMIVVLVGFVAFQSYELTVSPSAGLIALTVFDTAVVALTWREYRRQRQHHSSPSDPTDDGDSDSRHDRQLETSGVAH